MNKHEKKSEKLSMRRAPKLLIWGLIAFAFIGFLDTSYLTVSHYSGTDVNCSIAQGCNEVLSSSYSVIFGVPMALLGLLYYITILVLSLLYLDTHKVKILKVIAVLTALAFLFSGWLVYLQLFVIKEICQYCMISAINSVVLVILSLLAIKYGRK